MTYELTPIGCELAELEHAAACLQQSAAMLTPAGRAEFKRSGKSLGGVFQLAFLRVTKPGQSGMIQDIPEPTDMPCCNEGCPLPADKHCGRCAGATYCSADCQKADWKRHKKVCDASKVGENTEKNEARRRKRKEKEAAEAGAATGESTPGAASSRESVAFEMGRPDNMAGMAFMSTLSFNGGPSRMTSAGQVAVNVHGNKEFIIKAGQ